MRRGARVSVIVAVLAALCLPAAVFAQDAPPLEAEGAARQHKAALKPAAKAVAKPAAKSGPKSTAKPAAKPAAKADSKNPPLRSLDKNHDGRVSREEYTAGTRKRFNAADTNRDGVISSKEAGEAKARMIAKKARHDEKLRKAGRPVTRGTKSARPAKPYLSTFDKNHDGKVSQKEYLARREKKFSELDRNHDGVISREEARQGKLAVAQRRAERAAKAKEKRLAKIEAAKAARRERGSLSSPGPELTAPVSPPPAQKSAPEAVGTTPAPAGVLPPQEEPLTPLTPTLPAQPKPET